MAPPTRNRKPEMSLNPAPRAVTCVDCNPDTTTSAGVTVIEGATIIFITTPFPTHCLQLAEYST